MPRSYASKRLKKIRSTRKRRANKKVCGGGWNCQTGVLPGSYIRARKHDMMFVCGICGDYKKTLEESKEACPGRILPSAPPEVSGKYHIFTHTACVNSSDKNIQCEYLQKNQLHDNYWNAYVTAGKKTNVRGKGYSSTMRDV